MIIEKFEPGKVYSVVYFDGSNSFYYLKRFSIEDSEREQFFISERADSRLISITEVEYPRFEISFGGKNKDRQNEIVEVVEFIGIKSYKAKGKRLSTYQVSEIHEIEPVVKKEWEPKEAEPTDEVTEFKAGQEVELDPEDDTQMSLDL